MLLFTITSRVVCGVFNWLLIASWLLAVVPAYATLTDGLVAYYPFNGNANDASGNSNNGTVNGAILTTDRFDNINSAYSFNGQNQYITTTLNRDDYTSITFSAWFKFSGNISDTYTAILAGESGNFFIGKCDITSDICIQDMDYSLTGGANAWDGNWHLLVYTNNVGTGQVFLDGVLRGEEALSGGTGQIWIGHENEGEGYFFKGTIDDIRIYNRALSAAEITQLYQEGPAYQLTVNNTGTGRGTVTSNPAGINCSEQVCIAIDPPPEGCQCSANFAANSNVVLTAAAATGSTFGGWSNACTGTALNCTLTMNTAKSVTTTFNTISKPDFTIPVMTITPAVPPTNGNFTTTVTVKNQGAVAADGGQLRLWANHPTVPGCTATGGDKNLGVGTLAAGTSKPFTITGLSAGTRGLKTLRAFVDATCVRAESNDNNNQRTLSYRVAIPTRLPDLIITNIALTPATPAKNTLFNAAITVKNQGSNVAGGSFLDLWANQATAVTCGAVGNAWADVGILAAGASKVINIIGLNAGATAGAKSLRAFVDSWCETVESNEANNQLTKSYLVQ